MSKVGPIAANVFGWPLPARAGASAVEFVSDRLEDLLPKQLWPKMKV